MREEREGGRRREGEGVREERRGREEGGREYKDCNNKGSQSGPSL